MLQAVLDSLFSQPSPTPLRGTTQEILDAMRLSRTSAHWAGSMDRHARLDHLLALLGAQKDHLAHLEAHEAKLAAHHASKERDRAILATKKNQRRADRVVRGLERAVRNAEKQHAPHATRA